MQNETGMKQDKGHIDFEKEFFGKTNINYSKRKEDVWVEIESKLSEKPGKKAFRIDFNKVVKYVIAASLVIGLGLLSFLRFYTVSVNCPNGQHSSILFARWFQSYFKCRFKSCLSSLLVAI